MDLKNKTNKELVHMFLFNEEMEKEIKEELKERGIVWEEQDMYDAEPEKMFK